MANGFVVLAIVVVLLAYLRQPNYDGSLAVAGLGNAVSIARDRFDVPQIRAADRRDAIRALGFVHAQERFFQMDLLRRTAAGEQAELLGKSALATDRRNRLHQFRSRAVKTFAALAADERAALLAYSGGVNAGLSALRLRPVEYLLLGVTPRPWQPEDSLLVLYSLFLSLQNATGDTDFARGTIRPRLDAETYAFLFENGSSWSSTMDGSVASVREPPAIAGRRFAARAPASTSTASFDDRKIGGSNVWVVDGRQTKSGRPLLANDLHLPLAMPCLWYRAELTYRDARDARRSVVGVTLPGLPLVLVGSNGAVAWGVTNASIDTLDLVVLEVDPKRTDRYLTPQGWKTMEHVVEKIAVRGEPETTLSVRNTIWGPVLENRTLNGSPLAVRWIAHDPGVVDLHFCDLEDDDDVSAALATARSAGMPPLNVAVADADGHIGWSIAGHLPARRGFDGTIPVSFADGTFGWSGELGADDIPQIVNPPGGRIWNANNWSIRRMPTIGNGGFDNGARARQIEETLRTASGFSERDFLRLQHDDRALFFRRWATLLATTVRREPALAHDRKIALLRLLADWDGHASVNSAAFTWVRDFRAKTIRRTVERLLGSSALPGIMPGNFDFEDPVWRLVDPALAGDRVHRFEDTDAFLSSVLKEVVRESDDHWGRAYPISQRFWGGRNILRAEHSLSALFPALARWLNLPNVPLAGDNHMPLVAGPKFGASVRMVVSPSAENRGALQVPGGQSGDPLSPHYDDEFDHWLTSEPLPLRPGYAQHELTLIPATRG